MADDGGEKIEVKTLKTTDLKPADLTKAIEDAAKNMGKNSDKTTTVEKPASSKTAAKAKAANAKQETGSQIIVKKKTSYVGGPKPANDATSESSEPSVKETKVELKPPSATAKVIAAEPPDAAEEPVAQTAPTSPTPAASTVAAPPPAAPLKPATALNEEPQQALKVFDTTEYHLPIKPTAGRHYLNNFVAWLVLGIFLIAVTGYLLDQLEILDLQQFLPLLTARVV